MDAYLATADRLLVVEGIDRDRTVAERLSGIDPACVAVRGETVLVGTFGDGLWRAGDGDGYERVAPGALPDRVTALATAPGDPSTVYLGAVPSALFRSTNGGASFDRVLEGDGAVPRALAVRG